MNPSATSHRRATKKPKSVLPATTLNAKHQEFLEKMDLEKAQKPELESQLNLLKSMLKTATWSEKDQLLDQIASLEREISTIERNKVDYFLKNGELLFNYYEMDNQNKQPTLLQLDELFGSKKIEIEEVGQMQTKADYLRQFLSNVDPNFAWSKETTISHDNFCEKCQKFRVLRYNEAKMICPSCASEVLIIMDSDKPSLKEPPPETKQYEYLRFNHFKEWLAKIQGKESNEVPDEIIQCMAKEAKRELVADLSELEEETIRRWLKKYSHLGYDKYYKHSTQILFRISGSPQLSLTAEQERDYKVMFMMIQEPYERHRPETRSNFSSYSYIIYKFAQILGHKEVQSKMKLLKSKEKLHQLDVIWRKICKDLGGEARGWKYFPSI